MALFTVWMNLIDRRSIRVLFLFIFIIGIILNTATVVSSLERPTSKEIGQYKKDGTLAKRIKFAKSIGNHRASPSFVKRSHYKLRKLLKRLEGYTFSEIPEILAPPPAWKGMPTAGNVKVLALLIDFPDYPHSNTASSINSKLYGSGSGGYPYESLHNYYDRSSYSQLNIQGSTLGWYTTTYNRSSIVQNPSSRENLIKEVLNHYNSLGHDFTQYDNDGDGAIDYIVVIWSGYDNGWANFWWGYMTTFHDSDYTVDGKTLDTYSWQWEARPYPGTYEPLVVIHETGHALGLPDLYDYNGNIGPDGGTGGLDMMDHNWGDHNCFSKFVLDWITPTTINSGSNTVTMNASGSSKDAVVVMPGISSGDQFEEFFMVQNRYRANNDTDYPNDGLLIWHIDSRLDGSDNYYLYNNSYTDHKLVRLMEADGLEEIETFSAEADAGDYYTPGDSFGPDTFPNSHRYDGTPTELEVIDITAYGSEMTATIFVPVACEGSFKDVPPGYWAEDAICKIYNAGITTGCSQNPLRYCPEDPTNRAQMAVFLGRAVHGSSFTPSPATGIFNDVPVSYFAADWIELFYNDGITSGCGTNPLRYCPTNPVTRAQMAIFLLRAKHGSSYTPPPSTGIFSDVPITHFAADWIEQLHKEGITTGCTTNPLKYCPENSVTRAQMAVFIKRTFGL